MSLRDRQSEFAKYLGLLLIYAYALGYEISIGDVWAKTGHVDDSFHYKKLAADLNLFIDEKYVTDDKGHKILGRYWESLHPDCTWGGDFSNKDFNHYSYGEHGRKP